MTRFFRLVQASRHDEPLRAVAVRCRLLPAAMRAEQRSQLLVARGLRHGCTARLDLRLVERGLAGLVARSSELGLARELGLDGGDVTLRC
jgi:hypothetical protein